MKSFSVWNIAPALLYGLALLCGVLFALHSAWALLPFGLLVLTRREQMPLLVLLFLLPMPLLQHGYQQLEEGRFRIESFEYQYGWSYRGKLGLRPCTLVTKQRLDGSCHYWVKGRWKNGRIFLPERMEKMEGTHCLAEWRHRKKADVRRLFKQVFRHERAGCFLAGLVTGKLDDEEMIKAFAELGLLHLLAVSGFHFGVIIFLLHHCLRLLLPRQVELVLVMALMTLYALFIGPSASVGRAWIFMMVYLGGKVLERECSALNVLGVALIASLIVNPYAVDSIGFQLSFLATGGLLLFCGPLERALRWLFPKPTLYVVAQQHPLVQGGYLLTAFFRELFAVTLAVHLALLPLLLYHFHVFYPIGLLFNLFFPFLTAFSLALLPLYPVADLFADTILRLTERSYPPWYIEEMPLALMTAAVTVICLAGLCIEERRLFLRRQSLGL